MKNKNTRIEIFHSRLAAYSATATAALFIAPAAEATIQNLYSPTLNYTLTGTQQKFSPGLAPFNFSFSGSNKINTSHGNSRGIALINSGRFLDGSNYSAINLLKGASISGGNWGFFARLAVKATNPTAPYSGGQFLPGINGAKTGYIGLKSGGYYGWLRVKVSGDAQGRPDQISLVAIDGVVGAYDLQSDIANDHFTAGSVAPTPEPSIAALGGLALLACGAAGVREQRRRQQKQAD